MRGKAINGRNPRPAAETRSRALRLAAARAMWVALAILVLAIAFSAIPLALRQMLSVCAGNDCTGGQLSSEDARALAALGVPLSFYAWSETVWAVVIVLTMLVTATVIFWRQPNNRMTILTSFWLLAFFPVFYDGLMKALVRAEPGWYGPVTFVVAVGTWLSFILFYLFPSGKFAPGQARLMLLPVTAYALMLISFTSWLAVLDGITPLDRALQFIFRGFLLVGLAAQVYRYRRISSPVEQQQTKWVLFGMALFALQDIAFPLWPVIFPSLREPGFARSLYGYIGPTLAKTFLFLFIFSVAIAILRYRLWDIDIIIRRSLVYVPLTAILAGLFAASVALLQRVFIAATGQGSDLAAVLGTLLVVAALTPVKDRLQTTVDRRFKDANDPARKLNAFQEELRTRFSAIEPIQVMRRLTEEAMAAFNAKGGAVFWGEEKQPTYTCGEWDSEIRLSAAVASNEHKYGVAALSARRNGQTYNELDRATLEQVASFVAQVIEQDRPAAISDHIS